MVSSLRPRKPVLFSLDLLIVGFTSSVKLPMMGEAGSLLCSRHSGIKFSGVL